MPHKHKAARHRPNPPGDYSERLIQKFEPTDYEREQIIKTGVGRPIDYTWVKGLKEAFRYVMPSGIWLTSSPKPGVAYLSGEELLELSTYRVVRYKSKNPNFDQSTSDFLDGLHNEGIRLPTRFDKVSGELAGFSTHETESGRMHLLAGIVDVPTATYAEGFVVQGERLAMRTGFALPTSSEAQTPPVQEVSLGDIGGPEKERVQELLDDVRELMIGQVILRRISNITIESIPSAHTS